MKMQMLAIQKTTAQAGITAGPVPRPAPPQSHEVLIKVSAAGICGSDVSIYQWGNNYNFMKKYFPITLGHEFSGIVEETGRDVTHLSAGDPVVAMPSTSCMRCEQCLSGTPQMCPNKQTLGFTRNGAFAPYITLSASSCLKLPENTDLDLAALIEPLCVGDNAVDSAEIIPGDTVVVLGPGTIGQAIIHAAKWRGAGPIIAVGKNDKSRLEIAQAMGATGLIDLAESDEPLPHALQALTHGKPVDVVIEATGHPSSIREGLQVLRPGGLLVATGIHQQPADFDLTALVRNKQQLRGAHGSTYTNWQRMIARVTDHPEVVRPMLSKTLSLEETETGFQLCLQREVSKVVLKPAHA